MTIIKTFLSTTLLCASSSLWAWSNHTLISHQLAQSLPEVANAKPVNVESLEDFLMATEKEMAIMLTEDELWMRNNLWFYAPRPDALAFEATGTRNDIKKRFTRAIRVNPNMKLIDYAQLIPGDKRSQDPSVTPKQISVFKNYGYLSNVQLLDLEKTKKVKPLDVLVSANDEPDHGLDIGLFTDSNTDYGKEYGFGPQPFGNPNLEYGTQAPFHMGFYHESSVIYSLAGFLGKSYPEYRIHLFKRLSEFAFENGHDYWGWRFMGWGLHYIGDFSNPYHITPVPGNSTLKTIWVGLLSLLGMPQSQTDAIQLVSNRHTALEDFQSVVMTNAYQHGNHQHETITALNAPDTVRKYEESHVVNVFAKSSYDKAESINQVLLNSMPAQYVNDETVEYSELGAETTLVETVKQHAGEEGFNELQGSISDLLSDFSHNGASYIKGILKKAQ